MTLTHFHSKRGKRGTAAVADGRRRFRRRPSGLKGPEALEVRAMLDGEGILWAEAPHLTMSFAPDGTDIAGHPSELSAIMNNLADTAVWQEAIRRGFQLWSIETNADVGIVPDLGQPFGVQGLSQGDHRFGDIRVGAIPLPESVVAVSIPHNNVIAGTWVGDVIFNSDATLANTDELLSVALHEAGHVFGIEHSDDPRSPMFTHGISSNTQLTDGDVAAIQSLFGIRSDDLNERSDDVGSTHNNSFLDATDLDLVKADGVTEGTGPTIVYGDITESTDVDYYHLSSLDEYTGPVTVRLRVEGISGLTARMTVFDQNQRMITSVTTGGLPGDLSAQIWQTPDISEYFLLVEADRTDEFGIGGYSLFVTLDDILTVPATTTDWLSDGGFWFLKHEEFRSYFEDEDGELFSVDHYGNDSFITATELKTQDGFSQSAHYEIVGSLTNVHDTDYFRLATPENDAEQLDVLTVHLTSLETAPFPLRVSVFDSDELVQSVDVLVNDGHEHVVQLTPVAEGAEYYIVVSPGAGDGVTSGNYRAVVNFVSDPVVRDEIVTAQLDPDETSHLYHMRLDNTELVLFALQNLRSSGGSGIPLRLSVFDASNMLLQTMTASPGASRTNGGIMLSPGLYSLRIDRMSSSTTMNLPFSVVAAFESEPLGVELVDPTATPVVCPGPGIGCNPGDANLDGFVDVSDFNLWNAFKFLPDTNWLQGDFNGDQTTDVSDFNIWNSHRFTTNTSGALELDDGDNSNSQCAIQSSGPISSLVTPMPQQVVASRPSASTPDSDTASQLAGKAQTVQAMTVKSEPLASANSVADPNPFWLQPDRDQRSALHANRDAPSSVDDLEVDQLFALIYREQDQADLS